MDNSSPIRLTVFDTNMGVLSSNEGTLAPIIATHVQRPSDNTIAKFVNRISVDSPDAIAIPMFFLSKVEFLDDQESEIANSTCRITITGAPGNGERFLTMEELAEVLPEAYGLTPERLTQEIELDIPAQYISMLTLLSEAPAPFFLWVFEYDHKDQVPGQAEILDERDTLFCVSMVTAALDNEADIRATIANTIPGYEESIPGEVFEMILGDSHDNELSEKELLAYRSAQSFLLPLYYGLYKQQKSAYRSLTGLRLAIDEFVDSIETIKRNNDDYEEELEKFMDVSYNRCVDKIIEISAYAFEEAVKLLIGYQSTPPTSLEQDAIDETFRALMEGVELPLLNDLEKSLTVSRTEPNGEKVINIGPLEHMPALKEYLDDPENEEVKKYLLDSLSDAIKSPHFSEIPPEKKPSPGVLVTAYILDTITRLNHRFLIDHEGEEKSYGYADLMEGTDKTLAVLVTKILRTPGDPETWEIPALSQEIASFKVDTLVDLLHIESNDGHPYLVSVLHSLGHQIEEDELTPDVFARVKGIESLEIPQMREALDFIQGLVNAIANPDPEWDLDSDSCAGQVALEYVKTMLVPERASIEKVVWSIVALGEIDAQRKGYGVTDLQWGKVNLRYIHEFLQSSSYFLRKGD